MMFAKAAVPAILASLILQACNPVAITQEPVATAQPTLAGSTETAAAATATPEPTAGPTATVWPPIFDPDSLGDINELDSYVLTINEKRTQEGSLNETTNTIGYIKEPYRAYQLYSYPVKAGGEYMVDRTYMIDGWTYTEMGGGS